MAIGLAGILAGIGSLLGEELLKSGAKETVKIPFDAMKGPKGPTQMQLVGANGQPMDFNQGNIVPSGTSGVATPEQAADLARRVGYGRSLAGEFGIPQEQSMPPGMAQPQQQGLGQMMAPQQPGTGTKLRRGLGDALMGIGAIGLGGDPFQVMQGQRQARADSEQREIENKRAEQEWGMKERQYGLQERQVAAQEADAADKKADKERARKVGLSIAASIDPKLTMAAAQAYPVVDALMGDQSQQGFSGTMGGQPQQGGLGSMLTRPQGLDPYITDQEWKVMAPYIQGEDYEQVGKLYQEFLLSAPEGQKASSSIGKLQADLQAGLITPEQYDAAVRKENYIAPQAPRAANVINFRFPDGSMRAIDAYNQAEIQKALAAGALEVGLSAQGTSAENLFARPNDSAVKETQDTVSTTQGNLAELDNALAVLETPAAEWGTGLKGWFSQNVSGIVSQMPGMDDKAGIVTGPSLEDVQTVRTTMQGMLGRLIPSITNDDSGRYTEGDMQRVQAAARATDPKATMDEIKASFKVLRDVEERAHLRERVKLRGLDPASDEGVALYANELMKRNPGMDKSTAINRAMKESGAVNAR
jgi:hypothetical protein